MKFLVGLAVFGTVVYVAAALALGLVAITFLMAGLVYFWPHVSALLAVLYYVGAVAYSVANTTLIIWPVQRAWNRAGGRLFKVSGTDR